MYTAPNPVYAVKQCGLDAALMNHRLQPTPLEPKNPHKHRVSLLICFYTLFTYDFWGGFYWVFVAFVVSGSQVNLTGGAGETSSISK